LGLVVAASEPSCQEVLAIIQCYVDGECDVVTMVMIASHLDGCEHCDAELRTLRWLKAAVRRCGREVAQATSADDVRRWYRAESGPWR
jgi:anti-sigma factor RsiW